MAEERAAFAQIKMDARCKESEGQAFRIASYPGRKLNQVHVSL
jgi:hypothetical protein